MCRKKGWRSVFNNENKRSVKQHVAHLLSLLLEILDALDELIVIVLQAGALLCHDDSSEFLLMHDA